jgi:ankyrin repeat protein
MATPLNFAANACSIPMFDYLLEHGAKLDASIPLHMVALRFPIDDDWKRMVDHLLSLGVDVNGLAFKQLGVFGWKGTPLHYVVETGDVNAARYLLEKGQIRLSKICTGNL